MESAWRNEDWHEGDKLVAPIVHVENRRKIVGVTRGDLSSAEWITEARHFREPGMVRHRSSIVAIRGERLALTKVQVSTVDISAGAPQDEMLILYGIDDRGRIALQVTFDVGDLAAAITELDTQHWSGSKHFVHDHRLRQQRRARIDAKFNGAVCRKALGRGCCTVGGERLGRRPAASSSQRGELRPHKWASRGPSDSRPRRPNHDISCRGDPWPTADPVPSPLFRTRPEPRSVSHRGTSHHRDRQQ